MRSRANHSSSYLATYQNRRKQQAKHRKQVSAGIPSSAHVKKVSLSPEQRQAISAIQLKPNNRLKNAGLTSKRISWLIALSQYPVARLFGLHLIAGSLETLLYASARARFPLLISLGVHLIMALLTTLFIVKSAKIDDDAIKVEIMQVKEARKPKRRLPPKRIESVKPTQFTQVRTPRERQPITTAVNLPAANVLFTIPAGGYLTIGSSTLSDDAGIDASGLERKLLRGVHQAKINSGPPQIRPQRAYESIIEKIDQPTSSEADFTLETIEVPSAELKDVIKNPRNLNPVKPKYPDLARRAQKEGVVWIEATIGVDGLARDIKVTKGIGFGCDEAAIEALKASRFVPAKRGEEPIAVKIQIPYRFKLED